jgi:hypothetical protein
VIADFNKTIPTTNNPAIPNPAAKPVIMTGA